MDRTDYYKYYQANIELLNCELEQVKKAAQTAIGKKAWQEKKGIEPNQIAKTDIEIKACTRLFSFLVCSWFEARLMKMLYESSSAAFSDAEIVSIRKLKTMEEKWRTSFSIAVCKGYGITYSGNINYSGCFAAGSIEQKNYSAVCGFFADIKDAITVRNKLAHGQWDVQFNAKNTSTANYNFLIEYDNIQKLDILKQCFNHICEIISTYVIYKDKRSSKFDSNIKKTIELINDKKKRIKSLDYRKYEKQLGERYERQRNLHILK